MRTSNKLNLFLKKSHIKYKNEFVVKIDPDSCLKYKKEDSLFAMDIMILISMVLSFSDMLWYF
ncbi:hypothetical protein [Leptospira santarosai]|uniref:hypothetical protein n=1 Tax=Leptospira santarosai TaxID=28183 RepID=UPI00062D3804|nr:hypothetical protein [Leptospira santarosai]AVV79782.1 Uncharacterized protein XB15_02014 [Leptospira santarosai]OLY62918.1 hypothetical protein BWD11_17250 [Leptospira santarosai serovar Grippotyphosa]ONF77124.1 hypothetical protein BWD12_16315 [Leptospira santarosai serovar Bananal]ONF85662.1 hypothetical protein BWD13_12435 [Leptospira santarosai serovar Grippotyphosa]